MKASALKYAVLSGTASIIALILVLMPFHAFLTVWTSSLIGHYTAVRLWKEVLLALCVIGVGYLLLADRKIRTMTLTRRLVQLILVYFVVQAVWGIVAYQHHNVIPKALAYGWLIDTRFLLFFIVVWAIALRTSRLHTHWQKLLIWPSIAVVVFGLLQVFVLPRDFLAHFGYGPATIAPYETINSNAYYVRVASTLRGANPLGTYLILPICAVAVLLMRHRRDWQKLIFLLALLVVLFFSFSRAAWLGAFLSILVIGIVSLKAGKPRRLLYGSIAAAVIIGALLAVTLRNNSQFENLTFHTQAHSAIKQTSDAGHASALKNGLRDLARQPLGRGPGTAGPASFYNNHPPRIAENFFVQIGQETGWLGLAIFILINIGVGYILWLGRADPLSLALFASLVGISFVNMLSHAWSDDTLAYVWWGFAGIAVASLSTPPKHGLHVKAPNPDKSIKTRELRV